MKNIGKQDWKFLARIKKKNCRNVIGGKSSAAICHGYDMLTVIFAK